jgi:hypothetical protein
MPYTALEHTGPRPAATAFRSHRVLPAAGRNTLATPYAHQPRNHHPFILRKRGILLFSIHHLHLVNPATMAVDPATMTIHR